MYIKNKYLGIWFCLALCFSQVTFAVLPVTDIGAITNLIKNYNQLKRQYVLLRKSYKNAAQQLDQTKQLVKDAEGHYGFGKLLNNNSDLMRREWSPNDWQSTLKGLSGGNPARYKELLDSYEKNHPYLDQADFEKGFSLEQTKIYAQDVKVNRAAMVNASYAFNTINEHLKAIHQLSQKIDQAQNTKAAMDLNSRLITEVAYIQTQELKMQALLNQQLAQSNADMIAEKTAASQFNRLPHE